MTPEHIHERTRAFLAKYIDKPVRDDEDLFATGLVNSLFAMQLVLFVESEFKIQVSNEDLDLDNFRAIQNIGNFVSKKTGASNGTGTPA